MNNRQVISWKSKYPCPIQKLHVHIEIFQRRGYKNVSLLNVISFVNTNIWEQEGPIESLLRLAPSTQWYQRSKETQIHELLSLRSPGGILLPLILFIWKLIILPKERATRYFPSICHCQQALDCWQWVLLPFLYFMLIKFKGTLSTYGF